jgi:hypothetical protein
MKGMPHPSRAFRGRVGILTLFYRVRHDSLAKSLQSAKCDRRAHLKKVQLRAFAFRSTIRISGQRQK